MGQPPCALSRSVRAIDIFADTVMTAAVIVVSVAPVVLT